ncbi:hypothetical protein Tco_1221395 [Tanacetum coccineum]
MMCKPKSFYDEKHKGYNRLTKSRMSLLSAKQAHLLCIMDTYLVTTNHRHSTVIHDSEDTRELAETTRKRMLLKMQSPLCVENKVRIAPPDYSKENFLATFAPQRNLTPEQIFWSIDDNNRKKAETLAPKPISALTVYPPNTPVKLVPRILPTKSQVKINLYVLTQLFTEFDKTCKTRITPSVLQLYDESKLISKLEREYLNLQLKYQHLQESFDNKRSQASQEAPDFNSFFKIKNLEHQIQEKDNVIRHLKDLVANVNDRSREPYNAIDVTALIFRLNYKWSAISRTRKGVNDSTNASGSKPRSIYNREKIGSCLLSKENKKEVKYASGQIRQFCDSDLEVAFRKHTCFVRDINGTDILKGSRSTNLYTISMDEMMKSSPINA